ncbi:MAG: FecR domain-containing protein [Chryseolinea sp.]
MTDKEFRQLIQRYQDNTCTAKEKLQVEMWLNSLEKKGERFEDWEEIQKNALGDKMLASLQMKMRSVSREPRVVNYTAMLKIAASIVFAVGFGFWLKTSIIHSDSNVTAYRENTLVHGVNKYILPDGTIVWLKGESKLYYPNSFTGNTREVKLEGEALFEVSKDPAHPFIISCGSLLTRVLGTSFNIKSQPLKKHVEVVVFTGKVSLSDASSHQEIVLLPHEKALYETTTGALTKTAETILEHRYLEGTEYDMHFEDTPVSSVIDRIERKFNIKIKLQDEKAKGCLVSADLTDQSLEVTLKLISKLLGGEFKQHDEWVYLRIPACL